MTWKCVLIVQILRGMVLLNDWYFHSHFLTRCVLWLHTPPPRHVYHVHTDMRVEACERPAMCKNRRGNGRLALINTMLVRQIIRYLFQPIPPVERWGRLMMESGMRVIASICLYTEIRLGGFEGELSAPYRLLYQVPRESWKFVEGWPSLEI